MYCAAVLLGSSYLCAVLLLLYIISIGVRRSLEIKELNDCEQFSTEDLLSGLDSI